MERRKRSLEDMEATFPGTRRAEISVEQDEEVMGMRIPITVAGTMDTLHHETSLMDMFHSSQLIHPPPESNHPLLASKLLGYLEEKFAHTFMTVFAHHQIPLDCQATAVNLLQSLLVDEKARSIVLQQENRHQPILSVEPWNNQNLSKAGQDFCRAILVSMFPRELCVGFFMEKTVGMSDILGWYYHHLEANRIMYENIQEHHKTVAEMDWGKVTSDKNALITYKNAASAMGNKTWVWEANKWMADYCIRFFCQGGAARHYVKARRAEVTVPTEDKFWRELLNGLSCNLCSLSKRIKLVDVGSCYNPLSKLATANLFDITAFDLCPGDDSVLKGDFLDVELTDTHPPSAVQLYYNGSNERCLRSLPVGTYDVVTMSLVLSYLPNPAVREAVVRKAKRLLVAPGQIAKAPHHTGLLIIVEKQSILQATDRRAKKPTQGSDKAIATVDIWKETIVAMGFDLLAYQALPTSDGRKSHAFVFANTSSAGARPDPNSLAGQQNRLWIKQDAVCPGSVASIGSSNPT